MMHNNADSIYCFKNCSHPADCPLTNSRNRRQPRWSGCQVCLARTSKNLEKLSTTYLFIFIISAFWTHPAPSNCRAQHPAAIHPIKMSAHQPLQGSIISAFKDCDEETIANIRHYFTIWGDHLMDDPAPLTDEELEEHADRLIFGIWDSDIRPEEPTFQVPR